MANRYDLDDSPPFDMGDKYGDLGGIDPKAAKFFHLAWAIRGQKENQPISKDEYLIDLIHTDFISEFNDE